MQPLGRIKNDRPKYMLVFYARKKQLDWALDRKRATKKGVWLWCFGASCNVKNVLEFLELTIQLTSSSSEDKYL